MLKGSLMVLEDLFYIRNAESLETKGFQQCDYAPKVCPNWVFFAYF